MLKYYNIPDSVYDFFKWEAPKYWPRDEYGVNAVGLSAALAHKNIHSAWWQKWNFIYPHTLRHRFIDAICRGDFDHVKDCLDRSSGLLTLELYQGYTALSLATSLNKTAMVEYLLMRGADIDATDYQGRTPLIQAVSSWQIEAIKLLVSLGADIAKPGLYGYNSIDIAKHKGYEQIQRFLETKLKEKIRRSFPKVSIQFDFEKLLVHEEVMEIIQ